MGRFHGDPEGLAGVAIEAGGNIDGEEGAFGEVEGVDDSAGQASDLAGEAGAKKGVDDEIVGLRVDDPIAQFGVIVGKAMEGNFHGGGDGELSGQRGMRVASACAGVEGGQDADRKAGIVQVAGGNEAIAAVVAGAADDEDRGTGLEVAQGGLGNGPAGVFHENENRDAIFLHGAAVDFAKRSA